MGTTDFCLGRFRLFSCNSGGGGSLVAKFARSFERGEDWRRIERDWNREEVSKDLAGTRWSG